MPSCPAPPSAPARWSVAPLLRPSAYATGFASPLTLLYLDGTRATRNPTMLLRYVGVNQLRRAERQVLPLLSQLPPRLTRFEPSEGPGGSLAGLSA